MTFRTRVVAMLVSVIGLMFLSTSLAFAADIEVDIVVRGESTVAVPNATVTTFVRDDATGVYSQYGPEYIANSAGRANNVMIPSGSTFYGLATDDSGNYYAGSGYSFDNIWIAQSDGSIVNADNGIVRGPASTYVHLYPGDNSVTAADSAAPADPVSPEDDPAPVATDPTEPGVSTVISDIDNDFEVQITVYDNHRNPITGANVTLYLIGQGVYTTDITDGAGRTHEIMATLGYTFYATAVDSDGKTYGGTYDYYYKRQNIWRGNGEGETISNTSTGTTRLPYLHLYPEEFLPASVTDAPSGSEAFDPHTYLCGGFPDAVYEDITPEECTAIGYVVEHGIFSGTGEGLLEWNRPINRAEVTKVMLEAYDYATGIPSSYSRIFPDVPKVGQWFSNYVYNALANSIVGGYPDGFFRPAQTINRVELLRIFIEASKMSYADIPTNFTFWHDVDVNEGTAWFIPYANFAFFNELLENNGNLEPAKAMTRMDVIKLLYRASLIGA